LVYLEVIPAYIIRTLMAPSMHVCSLLVPHTALVFQQSNCITIATYLSSCSLYLLVPCYWHATLKSTVFHAGMKTYYNAIIQTGW